MFCSHLLPIVCRMDHVLFTLSVFLVAHSGVQLTLCLIFVLLFIVLCTICFQFLWMVPFSLPLQYSPTFKQLLPTSYHLIWRWPWLWRCKVSFCLRTNIFWFDLFDVWGRQFPSTIIWPILSGIKHVKITVCDFRYLYNLYVICIVDSTTR